MRNTNRIIVDEPVSNRILETMKEKGVIQQDAPNISIWGMSHSRNENMITKKYEAIEQYCRICGRLQNIPDKGDKRSSKRRKAVSKRTKK